MSSILKRRVGKGRREHCKLRSTRLLSRLCTWMPSRQRSSRQFALGCCPIYSTIIRVSQILCAMILNPICVSHILFIIFQLSCAFPGLWLCHRLLFLARTVYLELLVGLLSKACCGTCHSSQKSLIR